MILSKISIPSLKSSLPVFINKSNHKAGIVVLQEVLRSKINPIIQKQKKILDKGKNLSFLEKGKIFGYKFCQKSDYWIKKSKLK